MRQAILAAIAIATVLGATAVRAQEAKSTAGARALAEVLAQKKLDAIAARDPAAPDAFVAALHFPGQLMVISARYTAPPLLTEKLANGDYRGVYIELNAASVLESRVFVTDIGADGLQVKPAKRDGPIDMRDTAGKSFRFDGNWREDRMSEADYMKLYTEADDQYAKVVALLAAEARK
jgi:hypothetical protein